MNEEELDRILANEDEIVPSSGFVASVMGRIHEEIAAPEPIRFPWKRAIPGFVLGTAGLGWSIVEVSRLVMAEAHTATTMTLSLPHVVMRPVEGLGWAAAALCLSLATWKLVGGHEAHLL